MSFSKRAGLLTLSLVARSRAATKVSLNFIAFICRNFPDGRWKEYVRSAIGQVKWKDVHFGPKSVRVGKQTAFLLTPHLGQFDFDCMIWKTMPYEPELFELLDKTIKGYDVIFDIGANIGFFSLYAAKNNPNARIHSFEPSVEAFSRFRENIVHNNFGNIGTYNAAIADQTGFMSFYEPQDHLTNGSLNADFASIFNANVKKNIAITLSGDLLENFLETASRPLIKIDAEGAEPLVLNSLKHTILKYRPDMIIEVLSPQEQSLNELDFITKEYDLYSIRETGLEQMPSFIAHEIYRDYYLRSRS